MVEKALLKITCFLITEYIYIVSHQLFILEGSSGTELLQLATFLRFVGGQQTALVRVPALSRGLTAISLPALAWEDKQGLIRGLSGGE